MTTRIIFPGRVQSEVSVFQSLRGTGIQEESTGHRLVSEAGGSQGRLVAEVGSATGKENGKGGHLWNPFACSLLPTCKRPGLFQGPSEGAVSLSL